MSLENLSLNRYPDPKQLEVKAFLAEMRGVGPEQIFVGVGSDEAIDLLIRVFCTPRKDTIIVTPPTYGMYKVIPTMNAVGFCTHDGVSRMASYFQAGVPGIAGASDSVPKEQPLWQSQPHCRSSSPSVLFRFFCFCDVQSLLSQCNRWSFVCRPIVGGKANRSRRTLISAA